MIQPGWTWKILPRGKTSKRKSCHGSRIIPKNTSGCHCCQRGFKQAWGWQPGYNSIKIKGIYSQNNDFNSILLHQNDAQEAPWKCPDHTKETRRILEEKEHNNVSIWADILAWRCRTFMNCFWSWNVKSQSDLCFSRASVSTPTHTRLWAHKSC